jgi:NAD(P)-dependent dehydrogenase (short-subunit alcohol dehydrogenase family)
MNRIAGIALAAAGAGLALAGWSVQRRRRRMIDLRGCVAVITGGSRGLGLQLARELAAEGCSIALCARDEEELRRARTDVESHGGIAFTHTCDVSDRGQIEHFINSVRERFGKIDILVNNAGVIRVGPIDNMQVEDFEHAMNVMFWGVVYPTLAVLPHMRERRFGRIVNITSIGGKLSFPHLVPYSCAKAASVLLSEGLRTELKRQRIDVITIVPGLMRTGSFLAAEFKGQPEAEAAWFGLSATLPGLSMSGERAARQILDAIRSGRSELTLSLPAKFAARLHGLAPGLTADILAFVNRLMLPRPAQDPRLARGHEVEPGRRSRIYRGVTQLGRSAAQRMNQAPV